MCSLCGDRHETVNHIMNKCSKPAQKTHNACHNWVGKVIDPTVATGKNTEKCSGVLKRLALTQTLVKDHVEKKEKIK